MMNNLTTCLAVLTRIAHVIDRRAIDSIFLVLRHSAPINKARCYTFSAVVLSSTLRYFVVKVLA